MREADSKKRFSDDQPRRQLLMTVGQTAATCGVSSKTVKRWIADDGLPVHRLPGSGARPIMAVSRTDLDEWLAQYRHDPRHAAETDKTFTVQGRRFLGHGHRKRQRA